MPLKCAIRHCNKKLENLMKIRKRTHTNVRVGMCFFDACDEEMERSVYHVR